MKKTAQEYEKLLALFKMPKNTDGLTMVEIGAHLKVSESTANSWVKRAIREGKMEFAGRRQTTGITGNRCMTPVYRVKK